MTTARRAGTTAVLALVVMLAAASPAWAHAGGLSPTGVRIAAVTVTPEVTGLEVAVIDGGARLRVDNGTGSRVEVPPGRGRGGPVTVPAGESRTWIDARATTLERDLGPATTARWSVPMAVGTAPVTVSGVFVAEPPPAAPGWWAATAGIAAAVFVLARRTRHPDVVLAGAGLVAVLASLAHVVGATLAVESAPLLGTFFDATGIGLLVWPLVALAAIAALRGSAAGVLGVCAGAGLSVVFVLPDITVFHYAVLPFAGPADLERLLVAVVLGAGVAAAAAGAGALRALAARERPADRESEISS